MSFLIAVIILAIIFGREIWESLQPPLPPIDDLKEHSRIINSLPDVRARRKYLNKLARQPRTPIVDTPVQKLWKYACDGNIGAFCMYYKAGGKKNRRYLDGNKYRSLIAGAYENKKYSTVDYLLSVGETLTEDEKKEIDLEHMDRIFKIR